MITLEFLGAARTVTGSRFLVRTDRATVLVDAGLFQGLKADRLANWEPFPVDPAEIDAVVVTHAHIDHSGWLPGLVRDGFEGPIYATAATRDLCAVLLPDAGHLQEEQARFTNERGFGKHRPALPLYTEDDALATLPRFRALDFHAATEIADGVVAHLVPAGHILGSSSVHLTLEDGDDATTLLVSGDIGRGDHPVVPGPGLAPAADTVLVESTYGGSDHPPRDQEIDALAALLTRTAARGGVVLIPAFAVDRTEVLLTVLHEVMSSGAAPTVPVFVDSPMALRVLDLYRAAMAAGDPHLAHRNHADDFDPGGGLYECHSVEESKSLNELTAPAIIISASGMASGGRVLHHLARLLPQHRNSVVLCGFQAAGTRGRSLADGARSIRMLGRDVPVRAEVMRLTSLSVHADAGELRAWIDRLPSPPATVYVVHGEETASETLAGKLGAEGIDAMAPHQFDRVRLRARPRR
jgi:metallo-beta-lactamase family protein